MIQVNTKVVHSLKRARIGGAEFEDFDERCLDLGTLQLGSADVQAERLRRHLAEVLLPELITGPGLLGAHLLEGDQAASRMPTAEKRLRGIQDQTADWAVLLAGYDPDAIQAALADPIAPAALAALGASTTRTENVYRLLYCLA